MVLTCEDLFKVTNNPRINDITLDLLREYYAVYLNPYIFQFEIIDDNIQTSRTIELRFDQENFCHLLAIETIVQFNVNFQDLLQYKGQLGWDNVMNGTIDFRLLRKRETKQRFKDCKSKFVFFYLIPRIIEAPKGVLYNKDLVNGNTKVDCEILFYDNLQNAYVHLGIKYDKKLNYYIPKTFLIEKINSNTNKTGMKYIENQKKITVTKIRKMVLD